MGSDFKVEMLKSSFIFSLAWGFGLCGQNEFRDSRQQKISKILMVVTLRVGEGGGKSSCSSRLMPPGLVSSATVDTREGVELI